MILVLLSNESFKVLAFESSMKLHEISNFLIVRLSFKNSDRDSQNIWPRLFDERDKLSS